MNHLKPIYNFNQESTKFIENLLSDQQDMAQWVKEDYQQA